MNDLQELLAKLHNEVASKLLAKIKTGDATAADFTAAINLLRHNGIDCSRDQNLDKLGEKVFGTLPFQESVQ